MVIRQGLKPDPGNLDVRDFRGASANVRHGETVNPSRNRKSGNGNPSPSARRGRFLSRPSSTVPLRHSDASWGAVHLIISGRAGHVRATPLAPPITDTLAHRSNGIERRPLRGRPPTGP